MHLCTFFFLFFHLTYSRWTSSLPSCLWSQRIFPSLPGSRLTLFLSRCKFSTLTTRQPMVEFYLLTFPCFPLRKKEHKSYFGKNRTHDFRTSRCAAYLLDHSGDEPLHGIIHYFQLSLVRRLVFCSNSSRLIRSIILHSTQINTDTATDYISPRTSPAMGLSYRVPVSTTPQDFVSSERSSNVLYCCSPCCCCCCLHIKNRSDLYPVPFSFLLFKAKKRISVVTS